MKRLQKFFSERIWNVRVGALSRKSALLLMFWRTLALTVRFFVRNKCALHASALTFFTLFSIVPIAGLLFGIAKGYGYEKMLKAKLLESMAGQEQTAERIIQFAENALKNASGGVIAGVGVALLFWTALKLLSNIEVSFNEIWGVKEGRTWIRKLSDYVTMLLLCPLLLVALVSSSAFLSTRLYALAEHLPFTAAWNHLLMILSRGLPVFLAWGSFTFIYIFIPNTRVRFRPAAIAALFTGVLFVLLQTGYMYLQKILTGYNAIYGSFAALPFFLLWLQTSWTIILLGAQVAFSVQNVNVYELSPGDDPGSADCRSLCALRIMTALAHAFARGEGALSVTELSESLQIPIRVARSVLFDLCACGAAARLMSDSKAEEVYQTALPLSMLTPVFLFRRLAALGDPGYNAPGAASGRKIMDALWNAAEKSPSNRPLFEFLEK